MSESQTSEMSEPRVVVKVVDHVATVTLNREAKRNGMDLAMFEGLVAAGESVRARNDVRAVVLRGAGKAFCAGLDWQYFMSAGQDAHHKMLGRNADSPANLAQRACWIWQEVPVPVIAAVHGVAFGGGLQLALGADLRIAAPDTQLSVMESRYGLIPDMTATQTLLRLVREDIARELTFTARTIDGNEALAIGLVTRLAADPFAAATALAQEIAGRSPDAIRAGKRLFQNSRNQDAARSFALETEEQLRLLGSPNQIEAVMAVMQKRAPAFSDS